jgi:predicted transcriptional regulator
VVHGTVDGRDETNGIVILRIDSMEAPAESPAH